jgi:hypothetical protein
MGGDWPANRPLEAAWTVTVSEGGQASATKKAQDIKHLLTFPGTVPKFLPEPLACRI